MQNRIVWIDYSKALLMSLVVLAHCAIPHLLDVLICGFHMPAFFFISGYLHRNKPVTYDSVMKNVRRLLVPAVLFSLLCYVYWIAKYLIGSPFSVDECIIKPLLGLLYYDRAVATPVCGVIWFLVTLFLCFICLDFIVNKFKTGGVIFLSLICIITAGVLHGVDYKSFTNGYYLQRAIISFPFVGLGFLMKRFDWPVVLDNSSCKVRIIITLLLCALYISLSLYNGRVGIHSLLFGKSVFLYYAVAVLGSISFFNIVSFLKASNKYILTISAGTIVTLCLHKSMIDVLYHVTDNPYAITAIIMLMSYPIILFFNRYLKVFTGR